MPELGSYGSVRGARGNSRPYREKHVLALSFSGFDPQSGPPSEQPRLFLAGSCPEQDTIT